MNNRNISCDTLRQYEENYRNDNHYKLLTQVLSKTDINNLSYNTQAQVPNPHMFSIDIKTMKALNQHGTGRCWLFAAHNVLRERIAEKINVESLELAQNYTAFWDKFERANYFLLNIIDTADRDIDDREFVFILDTGVSDGGQWDMFVNITEKYGIVPKIVMPETHQSNNSNMMNSILNRNIKHDAIILRNMCQAGSPIEDVLEVKDGMMKDIYAFLRSCYGNIPETFDFEYKDKDGNYHKETELTPLSFKEKYIGSMLSDYVGIIHGPTADKPFDTLYTVSRLGNVEECPTVKHFNLDLADFKQMVINQLKDNEIVWFGCDCGKDGDGSINLWDDTIYDYTALTKLSVDFTKAEQLDYKLSAMNHAMVITGVHLDGDKPVRWKIENSWGDGGANGGYHTMSDTWFDKYVYQAVVNKKYFGDKLSLLGKEPVVLKPWDPMGTLAH
jgi:Aminopeptidase C